MFTRSRVVNKYSLHCTTENADKTVWSQTTPTTCPSNEAHMIDTGSITVIDSVTENDTHIRALQQGTTDQYDNIRSDIDNRLDVALPLGAFGAVKTVADKAVIQVDFRYGLHNLLVDTTTSGTGDISAASSLATLSSGTTQGSSAEVKSRKFIKYSPGTGINVLFTAIFTPGVAGTYQYIGVGSPDSGLFFGYNGTEFGIMRRQNSTTDIWTAQSDWSIDPMDGTGAYSQTLDTTKGNVYRICFQWLGFGMITFFIEHSELGSFVPVHRIAYSNKNTLTHMVNPSFPMLLHVSNPSSTSSVSLKTASFSAMLEGGQWQAGGLNFGFDNTKTISSLDMTNICTLRNKTTFASVNNYVPLIINTTSISTDGLRSVIVSIYKNATISGTASWADVSTSESVMEVDVSMTTITTGVPIMTFTLAKTDSKVFSLQSMDITVNPGDTFTLAAKLSASGSSDVTVSTSWIEYF